MDFALKRRLRVASPKRMSHASRKPWRSYMRTFAATLAVVTSMVVAAVTIETAVSVYGWFKHSEEKCSKRTWFSRGVCGYIDEPIKNGPFVALLFFTTSELLQPKILLNIVLASVVAAAVIQISRTRLRSPFHPKDLHLASCRVEGVPNRRPQL